MMNASSLSSMGFEFPASGSRTFQESIAVPDDHLQRLAQMTQHVGTIENDQAEPETTASMQPDPALYQSAAAAAYVQQYGNWPNYFQQFGQPMNPAAFTAAAAWPAQCYAAPPHWPTYAQSKKGRQTYQRYQTSVLESKFQQSSYVSKKQREELRAQTHLTDRQIKIWFQNRRMKAKKEKNRTEEQSEHSALLPANPPKAMVTATGQPPEPAEPEKKSAACVNLGWPTVPTVPSMPQPWGVAHPPPHPSYGYTFGPPNNL